MAGLYDRGQSPGAYYENDILGNRLWRNYESPTTVQRYLWDDVGRLQSVCGASDGARYKYRADGMRVLKVRDLTIFWDGDDTKEEASGFYDQILSVDKPTTRYYYDGQMPIEDDFAYRDQEGPTVTVTRYGIGARGIDFIGTWEDSTLLGIAFPIYDGHGNQIGTIGRTGTDDYVLQNARTYDVWGSVRTGSSSGFPNQRYCANLGHVQDDESDLIYMRARYYEPWTGRFVSEDPARSGWNWFVYCNNDPANLVDIDGQIPFLSNILAALGMVYVLYSMYGAFSKNPTVIWSSQAYRYSWTLSAAGTAVAFFALSALFLDPNTLNKQSLAYVAAAVGSFAALIIEMEVAARIGSTTAAQIVVLATYAYGLFLLGFMIADEALSW